MVSLTQKRIPKKEDEPNVILDKSFTAPIHLLPTLFLTVCMSYLGTPFPKHTLYTQKNGRYFSITVMYYMKWDIKKKNITYRQLFVKKTNEEEMWKKISQENGFIIKGCERLLLLLLFPFFFLTIAIIIIITLLIVVWLVLKILLCLPVVVVVASFLFLFWVLSRNTIKGESIVCTINFHHPKGKGD